MTRMGSEKFILSVQSVVAKKMKLSELSVQSVSSVVRLQRFTRRMKNSAEDSGRYSRFDSENVRELIHSRG